MRTSISFLFFSAWAVACTVFSGPLSWGQDVPELRVLTYDSLASPDGLGTSLFKAFEKRCRCQVRVQTAGDGAQMVSRLELEAVRGKRETQVVVGIDQTLWPQVQRLALDLRIDFPLVKEVQAELRSGIQGGFVPFDWGILVLISQKSSGSGDLSWKDLLAPEFRKKWILQDPRTSTPGFAWVWAAEQAVPDPAQYFSTLKTQWLTLTPGWSSAYGLFLKGEAPMVWSYSTSLAYHRREGKAGGFDVRLFREGNPIQIEGAMAVAAAIRNENERKRVREFMEFLTSPEVQAQIPRAQWMFPAREGTPLPQEFMGIPKPVQILRWKSREQDFKSLLRRWEGWIR